MYITSMNIQNKLFLRPFVVNINVCLHAKLNAYIPKKTSFFKISLKNTQDAVHKIKTQVKRQSAYKTCYKQKAIVCQPR